MKKCTKCGVEKDVSEFHKRKSSKDGLDFWCKDCTKIYAQKWRKINASKIKEQYRDWEKKNRDKKSKLAMTYYRKNRAVLLPKKRIIGSKHIAELTKGYLLQKAKRHGWTKDMIEQYPIILEIIKQSILNHRLIKKLKNDDK